MVQLSLFWRVVVTNALVFAVGTAVLAVSPATVSFPVAITEVVVLAVGFVAILVTNALLLRRSFRPLERLTAAMRTIDLLRPGQRLATAGAGEVSDVIETFNDMLDRLESERRTSSGRALLAQERERRRIAQELHDEIGQSLTAVLLLLSRTAAMAPPELRAELADAQETVRSSLDEVRRVARRLRPGVLEDFGLVRALRVLSQTFAQQTGVRVAARVESEIVLGPDVELALYRVAQEGLTNVARHAGASSVELSLARTACGVELRVADDGTGIPPGSDGAGLQGMRERAILVGGDLRIGSSPAGGAEIVLDVPGCRSR